MTSEDLKVIEDRANAATMGPWTNTSMRFSAGWRAMVRISRGRCADLADPRDRKTDAQDHANAEFIAHARTDVPRLVAEIRRLQGPVPRREWWP